VDVSVMCTVSNMLILWNGGWYKLKNFVYLWFLFLLKKDGFCVHVYVCAILLILLYNVSIYVCVIKTLEEMEICIWVPVIVPYKIIVVTVFVNCDIWLGMQHVGLCCHLVQVYQCQFMLYHILRFSKWQ
jgi:hypothetical protein